MGWTQAEVTWTAARVAGLVDGLLRDAPMLEISQREGPCGACVVDCGVAVRGSWEAGRRLAVIAHGGMMTARLGVADVGGRPVAELTCASWRPTLSTHGLQVSFALHEVDARIRVSGPVRAAMAGQIPRRGALSRRLRGVRNPWGVAVVESETLPGAAAVRALARRAGLPPRDVTLLVVPSRSLAGVAQIAGRVNECVLFTMVECLGLEVAPVTALLGAVPLAPCGAGSLITPDDLIHYAGRVVVTVDAPAGWDLQAVADGLVFSSSPGYGRLFSDLLREAGGVFEAIPGLNDLQKVAAVALVDCRSGACAHAGGVELERLDGVTEGERGAR